MFNLLTPHENIYFQAFCHVPINHKWAYVSAKKDSRSEETSPPPPQKRLRKSTPWKFKFKSWRKKLFEISNWFQVLHPNVLAHSWCDDGGHPPLIFLIHSILALPRSRPQFSPTLLQRFVLVFFDWVGGGEIGIYSCVHWTTPETKVICKLHLLNIYSCSVQKQLLIQVS